MIDYWLQTYLAAYAARNILDVGPGYSESSRVAARITGARDVTYVDCSEEVLRWQAARCAETGLRATTWNLLLTPERLGTLGGSYDLMLCQDVLEHLPDAEEILHALGTRLSAHGLMVITTPTRFSERWLRFIAPGYMRDEPFGHVRQFHRAGLLCLIRDAGLVPVSLVATQPHYFVAHTWLFGTRVTVESSTGRVRAGGLRAAVFDALVRVLGRWFLATGPRFWGTLLPRTYFVVARRKPVEARG